MAKAKSHSVRFRVNVSSLVLGGEGGVAFVGGEHEEVLDGATARLLASAVAAGGVEIIEGELPSDHIESEEVSLAAYEAAQADGRWQEGNLLAYEVAQANLARERAEAEGEEG